MWRRIISNRDPRDTIYRELKKEFSPYLGKANHFGRSFLTRHPKFILGAMILMMVASMVLSFKVFRHPKPAQPVIATQRQTHPGEDGFSQIMKTAGEIRQTLKLKHLVDSITAKKQLSPSDSTSLDSALSQLQRMHTHQNTMR